MLRTTYPLYLFLLRQSLFCLIRASLLSRTIIYCEALFRHALFPLSLSVCPSLSLSAFLSLCLSLSPSCSLSIFHSLSLCLSRCLSHSLSLSNFSRFPPFSFSLIPRTVTCFLSLYLTLSDSLLSPSCSLSTMRERDKKTDNEKVSSERLLSYLGHLLTRAPQRSPATLQRFALLRDYQKQPTYDWKQLLLL